MSRWLDLAAKLQADDESIANSVNSAKSLPDLVVAEPNGTKNTIGTAPLALEVIDGLEALRAMTAPRIERPEIWPAVVADAVRLARDGWALQALRLGWHPLEIWGCSPEKGGNPEHDGLAVWIDRRRVLLVDDTSFIVESGPDARSAFYRRSVSPGGLLLWDLRTAETFRPKRRRSWGTPAASPFRRRDMPAAG